MKKLTVILILAMVFAVCELPIAEAAIPHLISYQGRLTDAQGAPITGSRAITFRIYDAGAGGNLLWSETHSNATLVDGIFEVLLGSVSALNLPFDKQYYMAIQIGNDPEMTPRQKIASAGYAYRSEHADAVDGYDANSNPVPNSLLSLDANAKFPDSVIKDSASTHFGSWVTKSEDTVYRAATDGIVVVTLLAGGGDVGVDSTGYTDGSNPPTAIRGLGSGSNGDGSIFQRRDRGRSIR